MQREKEASQGTLWAVVYATFCYFIGVGGLAYCILFLENVLVPTGIDASAQFTIGTAIAINAALILFWGLQHSVMARQRFKQWWTRYIPAHTERATYVLASGVALAIVCWGWAPIAGTVWTIEPQTARLLIQGLGLSGWLVLLAATFEIDHGELFGLKQPIRAARGTSPASGQQTSFQTKWLYRIVRHPIQLGVLMGMWITPTMTVSRAVFASAMTAYIIIGLYFEERALVRDFGETYRAYQAAVPMLIPLSKVVTQPLWERRLAKKSPTTRWAA